MELEDVNQIHLPQDKDYSRDFMALFHGLFHHAVNFADYVALNGRTFGQ